MGLNVKKCLNAVVETLYEGKQKDEMCGKQKLNKSRCQQQNQPEILADDVLAQLDAAIQSTPCISFATDKSQMSLIKHSFWCM